MQDNPAVEAFFKTIKADLIWGRLWVTRRQTGTPIFQDINGFCNPHHRQLSWEGEGSFAYERQGA